MAGKSKDFRLFTSTIDVHAPTTWTDEDAERALDELESLYDDLESLARHRVEELGIAGLEVRVRH